MWLVLAWLVLLAQCHEGHDHGDKEAVVSFPAQLAASHI